MSPRRNWDSPNPSPASECALPPGPTGGEHTRLRLRGWGRPNCDDWRKSLALCLLCEVSLLCSNIKTMAFKHFFNQLSTYCAEGKVLSLQTLKSTYMLAEGFFIFLHYISLMDLLNLCIKNKGGLSLRGPVSRLSQSECFGSTPICFRPEVSQKLYCQNNQASQAKARS